MISLQTTAQIHDVITWNDATITGLLLASVLALGSVVYYLFKTNQDILKTTSLERDKLYQEFTSERDRLYKEHLGEIKSFNDLLMKINNQYYESIRNLVDLQKK